MDDFLQAALILRARRPEPLSLQNLLNELQAECRRRPQRSAFKEAIRTVMPDANKWIMDLDAAPVIGATKDLLEEWAANPASRAAMKARLEQALEREDPDGPVVNAARALKVADGTVVWVAIRPDEFAKELRQEVISAAIEADELDWAITALCLSPSSIPKPLRERLVAIPDQRVLPIVARRIAQWSEGSRVEPAAAEALNRLASLAAGRTTPELTTAALVGVAAAEAVRPAPKWVSSLVTLASGNTAVLADSLEALPRDSCSKLVDVVSALPGGVGSPRLLLLRQICRSGHHQTLARSSVWRDIKIDVIGDMLNEADIGDRLAETCGESVFAGLVAREAATSPAWRVLMLAGKWPRLAQYVTIEHLDIASKRSDASAALVQALVARAEQSLGSAVARVSSQVEDLDREVAARDDELQALRQELLRQGEEESALRDLLAEQASRGASAFTAEINQGRVDALRALVELTEQVRALQGLTGRAPEAVATVLGDALFRLAEFGVQIEGQPGDVRQARPDTDEGAPRDAVVEVITPAYLLPSLVTPLRRAFVRVIEGTSSLG
jgi:hypothetical protein